VFHFAASLRLEAPLKEGLEMNTKGTLRVLDLAKRIKKLAAFIHLSTAFCYPDYERMAEKVTLNFHSYTSYLTLIKYLYVLVLWIVENG
jgi:alcohol-forming fatty acyl-CoA reductase